jgi:hypothetical protein
MYSELATMGCFMQREVVARWFMQQLIAAVDYCHKKGIVSRDIKCVQTPNFTHNLCLDLAVSWYKQSRAFSSGV